MVLKHRLHLSRRARQQNDCRALVIDEHARCCAVWIWQHLGVFEHHRLPGISFRHRHAKTLKASLDLFEHSFVEQETTSKRACSYLSSDVVFGGAETAGGDDNFGTP